MECKRLCIALQIPRVSALVTYLGLLFGNRDRETTALSRDNICTKINVGDYGSGVCGYNVGPVCAQLGSANQKTFLELNALRAYQPGFVSSSFHAEATGKTRLLFKEEIGRGAFGIVYKRARTLLLILGDDKRHYVSAKPDVVAIPIPQKHEEPSHTNSVKVDVYSFSFLSGSAECRGNHLEKALSDIRRPLLKRFVTTVVAIWCMVPEMKSSSRLAKRRRALQRFTVIGVGVHSRPHGTMRKVSQGFECLEAEGCSWKSSCASSSLSS
nr:hypothetical protein Iba_chr07eCG7390 [Ipomoea batatas]